MRTDINLACEKSIFHTNSLLYTIFNKILYQVYTADKTAKTINYDLFQIFFDDFTSISS